ncbi:MAG: NYN domain-containing protein [Patescibacteria group bacterium]|nr:NYN domain-containing protein [Patescibacteria group bacterium]
MRHKDQRIGIFIDVQNLYHSAKNFYHAKINYRELVKVLIANRQLIRALGYVVKSETLGSEEKGEQSFFGALEKAGIDLRIKDLQIFPGGMKKADWDVGMAVDAIRMSEFLDVVILVTGDGDFMPLLDYLKWGKGRIVEVAAFGRNTSARLKESADVFIDLGEMPRMLLKK